MSLPSWVEEFQDHTSNAEKIKITVENAVFTLSFHFKTDYQVLPYCSIKKKENLYHRKWFELRIIGLGFITSRSSFGIPTDGLTSDHTI